MKKRGIYIFLILIIAFLTGVFSLSNVQAANVGYYDGDVPCYTSGSPCGTTTWSIDSTDIYYARFDDSLTPSHVQNGIYWNGNLVCSSSSCDAGGYTYYRGLHAGSCDINGPDRTIWNNEYYHVCRKPYEECFFSGNPCDNDKCNFGSGDSFVMEPLSGGTYTCPNPDVNNPSWPEDYIETIPVFKGQIICGSLPCEVNGYTYYRGSSSNSCAGDFLPNWSPTVNYKEICRSRIPPSYTCTSHSYSQCYAGDIYWYDSCDNREEKKTECGECGCSDGSCSAPANYGDSCTVGVGECERTGSVECDGSCSVSPGTPGTEVCNGLDDNCNGIIDGIDEEGDVCINISSAFWSDLLPEKTPIDEADLNDRVRLNALGQGFQNNEINFSVMKKREGIWGFFWFDAKVAEFSSEESTTWKANEPGEYYFKSLIESEGIEEESGILNVTPEDINTKPVANIIKPERGDRFNKGKEIDFAQFSYDVDDFFNYVWNFGDTNSVSGNTSTMENYNTTHSYSEAGLKRIGLNVEDERGSRNSDSTYIQIIDPENKRWYVYPNMSQPQENQRISEDYTFMSEGSYVFECNATNDIDEIDCGENLGNLDDFDSLNWSLIYSDEIMTSNQEVSSFSVEGMKPGEHKIFLEISKEGVSETAETNFEVETKYNFQCNKTDDIAEWINYEKDTRTSSLDNCKITDQGDELYCCPEGQSCTENSDGDFTCSSTSSDVLTCDQYVNQSSCEGFDTSIAKNSVQSFLNNDNACTSNPIGSDINGCQHFVENCSCVWDNNQGVCKNAYDESTYYCDAGNSIGKIGTCTYTGETFGNCEEGDVVEYTLDANWKWASSNPGKEDPLNQKDKCVNKTRSIPCPAKIRLPFMNPFGIILLVLIIIGIYYFSKKQNKDSRKKKTKR